MGRPLISAVTRSVPSAMLVVTAARVCVRTSGARVGPEILEKDLDPRKTKTPAMTSRRNSAVRVPKKTAARVLMDETDP